MTLILGETTYLTRAAADAYFADRAVAAWAAATVEAREAALLQATAYLDVAYRFLGALARPDQALAWPRQGVRDAEGRALTGIPPAVAAATAELALIALLGDLAPAARGSGHIRRERAGPVEVEYQATPPTGPRFPFIAMLLRDVAVPGGDHWGGDDFAGAGRGGRRASRRVARA